MTESHLGPYCDLRSSVKHSTGTPVSSSGCLVVPVYSPTYPLHDFQHWLNGKDGGDWRAASEVHVGYVVQHRINAGRTASTYLNDDADVMAVQGQVNARRLRRI